ncbi:MAG: hypothetical protein NTZ32_24020 [Planctomycetales bacterium]|nr:hypothetical protein [Planctomycetales bacterium]
MLRRVSTIITLRHYGLLVLIGAVSLSTAWVASCDEPNAKAEGKASSIDALREYNGLIGGWRGVGQPKRGSQQGAWQEKTVAVWELKPKSTGIRWNVETGKQWKSALLGYDEKSKKFTLKATLLDDATREYQGQLEDKRLVLESVADAKTNDIHRLTLTTLNENRMTLLFEKRPEQQSFYSRVAEIGYQREGTRLAAAGTSGPVCVVTGGLGTMAVMHKGKTYYVCCTGCRDAFNDDPEGILAEYEKSKAKPAK